MSIFSKISIRKPKRTVFNLSYASKLSLPFGRLIPIMCEKVVPGDKFIHSHEFLLRFAPFVGQVFQSFKVRTDYFYVPSRILWKNFERFLVDENGEFAHPYFPFGELCDGDSNMTGTLVDYFNLPTVNPQAASPYFAPIDGTAVGDVKVDALPFAAYFKIFMDYYADENLLVYPSDNQTIDYDGLLQLYEEHVFSQDGSDFMSGLEACYFVINGYSNRAQVFAPFFRAYPKDYFTSALPFAQRGPIVQIPMNGAGDVVASITTGGARNNYENVFAEFSATSEESEVDVTLHASGAMAVSPTTITGVTRVDGGTPGSAVPFSVDVGSSSESAGEYLNRLREAPAIQFKAVNVNGTATISDLRTAFAVQSWLEKNARAGVRYKEQLMSHFGVRSRDYRLDRAQLLQSSSSTVSIGEVFTTAANEDGTFIPGLGISTATGSQAVKPFKKYFDEHGYVIGLMTVYPSASYYQGIPKQFTELDKYDYYWPEFQHIGEQEIKNMELYLSDEGGNNSATFGYTPRYAQYKARVNQVHGDFRTSLMYMHAGRSFASQPRLNMDFINMNPEKNDSYRVFNFTEDSPFHDAYPVYCDFFHNFKAIRPMSYFGNPRII